MASKTISVTTAAAGNFTVANTLGVVPTFYLINMTSSGMIFWQSPTKFDASNLYLVATDSGLTADILISTDLSVIPTANTYPQVSDILAGVENDLRLEINQTDNPAVLIDYCNRVHLQMLRFSRWQFLLSPPQRFVTQMEQTDYWVGPSGANPAGTVDTGLNLSDMGIVREGTVFDRSNYRNLKRTTEPPNIDKLELGDSASRPGRPRLWRNAPDTPNIINLYPKPNNQNDYQPQPNTPIVTYTAGGSLPARIEFYKISYVDDLGGESVASQDEMRVFIPANNVAVVNSPNPAVSKAASGVGYSKYKVYAATVTGAEQLQTVSPVAIGTNWTEPTSGLISGTAPVSGATIETLWGYVMEFRYYKARQQLTTVNDFLQVPLLYKDIIIAGVNALGWMLIGKDNMVAAWTQRYVAGLTEMVKDKNLFPKGQDFVQADPSAVTSVFQPSLETYDIASLLTL